MAYIFTNNATTTLSGAITAGQTTIPVTSSAGFPPSGDFAVVIGAEILLVTGVVGTTWTVTRGAEGTTAASHPSAAAVAHVVTADWLNNTESRISSAPTGVLGYAAVTANQGSIGAAETDLTGLAVTVNVPSNDRLIRITAQGRFNATATERAGLRIKEGGTQYQQVAAAVDTGLAVTAFTEVILNPTQGSHTFKLAAISLTGAGFLTLNAAATAPAFILVEDIGAA